MQRSRSSAISGEIGIGFSNVRFGNVMRVLPGPVAERQVLQRALAALVADRAVERVVDEDELERRVLALGGLLRGARGACTTMPSCAVSVQPAWSFGIPSTSTRHMRQAPTGGPSRGS